MVPPPYLEERSPTSEPEASVPSQDLNTPKPQRQPTSQKNHPHWQPSYDSRLSYKLIIPLGLIVTSCSCTFLTLMRVLQPASKWLEEHVPADYQNAQEYVRTQLPGTDPQWDPNISEGMQRLTRYREALLEGVRKGAQKAINIHKVSQLKQGQDESPAQFHERLCEAFHIPLILRTSKISAS
ncbi:hypothetical protein AAY473_017668 [Plecturocebus cupreus]